MGKKLKRLAEVLNKPSLLGLLREKKSGQEEEEDLGSWNPSEETVKKAKELIFTEEDFAQTKCGIGSFTPPWLQVLARKESYLAVFCMVGLVQGMFFSYTVSVVSTLEKRFKLTSKQTGIILCGNDISQVILAMLLGYYGNHGHRPRWVGVGVLCTAISCFLAALPHFLYGPGQDAIDLVAALNAHILDPEGNATHKMKKMEVCPSTWETDCVGEDGLFPSSGEGNPYLGPIVLFFISQFFVGISISLFYSIGITYLDDNVNKKTYPLYYSITLLLRILGPVLGFLVGGRCLSTWIDPVHNPNIEKRDPRWLGAWWLGYMFLGCGLTCVGSLLFFFPRHLPATLTREAKRVARQAEREKTQKAVDVTEVRKLEYFASLVRVKKEEEEKPTIANLRIALGRLFRNKLWLGNLFNTVVVVFAFSGYWNFKPKYLENQFRKSAAEANFYTGVVSLASVLIGTLLGGIILRWVRPRPFLVAAYNVFVTLFVSAGFLGLMFIGCPNLEFIGSVDGSSVPSCASECGCSQKFSPMCSEDNHTIFFSPCYAACTNVDTFAKPVVFSGCGCIGNSSSSLDLQVDQLVHGLGNGEGVSGYCPKQCEEPFMHYIILQIVIKTVSSTARVGSSVLLLRSVADKDKGLALGTLTVFMSLFAFIPAPIIMGAIIDSSCLLWETSCGSTGNCWIYDSDKFRIVMHLIPSLVALLSVLGDLVVLWYSRKMDLYGDKEHNIDFEVTTTSTTTATTITATPTSAPPTIQSSLPTTSPQPDLNANITHKEEEEEEEKEEEEEEEGYLISLFPPSERDYIESW